MFGNDTHSRRFPAKIDECLEALKKHAEEHDEIYTEAVENHRKAHIEKLQAMLATAQSGGELKDSTGLKAPVSFKESYESAIGLLETMKNAGETIVELTAQEHAQFVRNRWDWVSNFNVANSRYTAGGKLLGG